TLRRVSAGWSHLSTVSREAEAWLAQRAGLELFGDALALCTQEDLAIVRGPSEAEPTDSFEWLHVTMPSNWAPIDKIGRSFVTAHAPVVHSERLQAAAPQIVRAMIQGGPFTRYVWGIHRDGAFCHNPRLHHQPAWVSDAGADLVKQAYFRVERQTTCGFPTLNRALFTIRYWTIPLTEVISEPWRRERLTTALAAMDEAELAYKGLTEVRDPLVAYLSVPE
ncbi:MAG TPA: heme-dependent oxidative N-demethylase subunit alpha family protein, partial [Symbiobacteriaceae bacterium]|nr:heme-dependent oxidative N-demethylase subunit alpha family protein [Symbiobacteriaceae bacterium]